MNHELPARVGMAAGLGVVAAAGNLLGGLFVVRRGWPRGFLHYFLAAGAGDMLALAFTHVISGSVRLGGAKRLFFFVVGCFFVRFFCDSFWPPFFFF